MFVSNTAGGGYQIQRSLRFRSGSSAYLSRTPAVAGNRKTWTWSGWVKRGRLSAETPLFQGYVSGADRLWLGFDAGNTLQLYGSSGALVVASNAVFRDPSAYYHILASFDTTQATAENRARLFVNGVQQSIGTGTYPALNADWVINAAVPHQIGSTNNGVAYFDGYLSEVNFIDGQALTPSSFGEFSPVTGQWQAKKYAGTYGTNGFYLPFTDNSAATAAAIGADKSGNGNNWTPNNISLTSGVTYDSMLDVPLGSGGGERGNYCTLNPLNKFDASSSDGNLQASLVPSASSIQGTIATPLSGKWYWEMARTAGAAVIMFGVVDAGYTANANRPYTQSSGLFYAQHANKISNGVGVAYGATYTNNDVIGVALDADAGTLTFYKNGVSQGVAYSSGIAGLSFVASVSQADSSAAYSVWCNFGQRPFAYTPPAGFKALHTGNLPDPVIKKPSAYFAATTYTGNGTTQSVSNAVNGVGFQPDLVWAKARSNAYNNYLGDSVRGSTNILLSNTTLAESSVPTSFTSFNSNGFAVGDAPEVNGNAASLVAWQWKANGAAVANNAGSIASQVSAGAAQGFSVVTYTGNGINGATVGHGLSVSPSMWIIKKRVNNTATNTGNWIVVHKSIAATGSLSSSTTFTLTSISGSLTLNNTAPSGNYVYDNQIGGNGDTFVAYCFSEVAGFSKFGSYVGNGSADGAFCFTGFMPRFVMFKRTDTPGNWIMLDSSRSPDNVAKARLDANGSAAEITQSDTDLLSNGFKLKISGTTDPNISGGTYIFMAFAASPFKFSLAR